LVVALDDHARAGTALNAARGDWLAIVLHYPCAEPEVESMMLRALARACPCTRGNARAPNGECETARHWSSADQPPPFECRTMDSTQRCGTLYWRPGTTPSATRLGHDWASTTEHTRLPSSRTCSTLQ